MKLKANLGAKVSDYMEIESYLNRKEQIKSKRQLQNMLAFEELYWQNEDIRAHQIVTISL